MAHFWFCHKNVHQYFEKLTLKFSKRNLHPCHPQEQRAANGLWAVIQSSINKLHPHFLISKDVETYISILKWGKTAWQCPFKLPIVRELKRGRRQRQQQRKETVIWLAESGIVIVQIHDNEKCSNLWFSRQREHTTEFIFYISFYSAPTGPFVTRFVNTIELAQEKIIVK